MACQVRALSSQTICPPDSCVQHHPNLALGPGSDLRRRRGARQRLASRKKLRAGQAWVPVPALQGNVTLAELDVEYAPGPAS